MQPLVSIVIATYNGATFLKEQMDSLLKQTYTNIEIVAVDDCSTDNTIGILNEYAATFSNVRVFRNELNLGYQKNFEKGMLLCKGDFIAPSDQDDIWELNKIEVLLNAINDHEIVYCNSLLIDDNGNKLNKKLSDIKTLRDFSSCLNFTIGNTPAGHAMLINKELIQHCIPFPTIVPHDFWLGFIAAGRGTIKFIDNPLVLYRQHVNNVFGAIKLDKQQRKKNKKIKSEKTIQIAREKMKLLFEKCPENLVYEKHVLKNLNKSYQNFSFANNWLRMIVFFKNWQALLAYKKKPVFRKILFCFKMFAMIK